MGNFQTKEKGSHGEKVVEGLKNKVRDLQGEIKEIMAVRESENQAYERELMVFAFKQAEWRRDKRKLKDEAKKLRKRLEEKEERSICIEESVMVNEQKCNNELQVLDKSLILEHIKEEQARRDETIEKWKQLYFAIKVELDDLIQRTHQEERLCWKDKEEVILLQLNDELRAKEERIICLQAKLDSMKQQECKREREIDILRQSLRIMSHKNKAISDRHQRHGRYCLQHRPVPKVIP